MEASKIDLSKVALCNVCSRLEKCVQVLCEGRCLICLRCEHSPPIQRLLFNIVYKTESDAPIRGVSANAKKSEANGKEFFPCPLCDHSLANSMLVVIRANYAKMNTYKPNSKPGNFMADSASIFTPSENVLMQFVRRFRVNYPEIFEPQPSREFAPPIAMQSIGDKNNVSAFGQSNGNAGSNSLRMESSSKVLGADSQASSSALITAAKASSASNNHNNAHNNHNSDGSKRRVDPYAKGVPALTTTGAQDVIIDLYCALLGSLQRSVMCDCMADSLIRINDRKKYSQRTNDYRVKSIIDYFLKPENPDAPEIYLVLKLLGLLPKNREPRPLWSSIAAAFMAFTHSEKVLKQGRIFDEYGVPSVMDLRKLFEKSKPAKVLTLRKAFRIISAITIGHQPHWICVPLYAACVESGSPMFWTAPSMSRLLNMVIEYALTGQLDTNVVQARASSAGGLDRLTSESRGGSHEGSPSEFIQSGNGRVSPSKMSDAGGTFGSGGAVKATGPPGTPAQATNVHDLGKTNKMKNLQAIARDYWKAKVVPRDGRRIRSRTPSPLIPGTGRRTSSPVLRQHHSHSSHSHVHGHAQITHSHSLDPEIARAQSTDLITSRNTVRNTHAGKINPGAIPVREESSSAPKKAVVLAVPSSGGRTSRGFSQSYSVGSLDQLDTSSSGDFFASGPMAGSIVDGCIPDIDCETALEHVDGNLTITAAELILICLEAWEEEYQYVKHCCERAGVSKLRRPAVCGKFNVDDFQVNAEYRLAVERIIDWYSANGYRGVDWDDVKVKGANREFPFHIPAVLLNKSCAELNYAMETIQNARTDRRARETLEDMLTLSGPYGHISKFQGFESMKQQLALTRDEKEALIREKYLQSQTLGHNNLVELVGVHPRVHLDPFSHQGFTPVATDNRASSARVHAKGYEFSDEFGISGAHWGSDNRLKSPTVKRIPVEASLLDHAEHELVTSPIRRKPEEMLKVVEVYPEVITRKELITETEDVSDFRETIQAPTNFAMPQLPGLQEDHFYSINPRDAEMCAQAAFSGLRGKLSTEESAKNRIRARLERAIAAMNKQQRTETIIPAPGKPSILNAFIEKEKIAEEQGAMSADASALGRSTISFGSTETLEESVEAANKKHGFESTLDIANFLDNAGIFSDSSTKEEAAVNAIALKGLQLSAQRLQDLADRFLKPWQLIKLQKADFTDTAMDLKFVQVLSAKFVKACNLVHLNVSGCKLGENGMRDLLTAIVEGGGAKSMLRLDLQQNQITLATDALAVLRKFTRLRALDLSLNYITLDIRRQQDFFSSIMLSQQSLRSLSVAFNRIQDVGYIILYEILGNYCPNLKVLDLANCFITNKSVEIINVMVQSSRPKLDVVMLQGNLLFSIAVDHLRTLGVQNKCCVYLQDDPYVGIVEPLQYNIAIDAIQFTEAQLESSLAESHGPASDDHEKQGRRSANARVPNQQHKLKKKAV